MVIFKSKQKKCEGNVKIKYHGKKLDPTESVKYPGFSNSVLGVGGIPSSGCRWEILLGIFLSGGWILRRSDFDYLKFL